MPVVDIFDEVEEELRAERARRAWRRFGPLMAVVLVLGIGGVAGWQGYAWWQNRQAQTSAMAFLAAQGVEGSSPADQAARFTLLAAQSPTGYRTLARLRAAALQAEAGERNLARATLDQVTGDTGADPIYRDLANLLWVLHGLDDVDPAVLAARITPLTAPGSAWRASAQELAALVELRRGHPAEAKRALEALANDAAAPQGVRERALRLSRSIEG
ncbi:tetratricopeptide repeat protein [Plastoroseomonas arctica]|uniref:Tetratricopeptide repeat protein n=1 Tax=Plastoroseomonas arctica TaxID=1509237 RepID=A0AAF1K189_9PROT|nr:tetratricopeptide repeat protein [Plastoroseomonas arctica]MBR0654906.1 tetratricopeptide repeat protein [Plastoroseomonas arctica]